MHGYSSLTYAKWRLGMMTTWQAGVRAIRAEISAGSVVYESFGELQLARTRGLRI